MNHSAAFSQDDHKGRRSEKIRAQSGVWIMDFGNVYLRETAMSDDLESVYSV